MLVKILFLTKEGRSMIRLFVKENKGNNQRLTVRDQNGQILFLIQGGWGQKNDIINLFNLNGDLLLQAKQINLSPFFQFELFQAKEKVGTIRKHPGFFGLRDAFFTIQPQNWLIKGDFEELYFEVFKEEEMIMTATKLMHNANYLFSLNIKKDENLALGSLVTVLLDHYSREKGTLDRYDELEQNGYNLGFLNYKSYPNFYFNKEKILKKTR